MSLLEQPSEMSAKEKYLAELDAQIEAAEAQHKRLTVNNTEIAAALRVQAMVEARHDAALEVEAERSRIAARQAELDSLLVDARKDRQAAADALAATHASAEQRLAAKLNAAHAAAREALRGD